MQHSGNHQNSLDDDDRKSRFHSPTSAENGSGSLRERAASQPPHASDQNVTSPSQQHLIPSSLGGSRSPWSNQQRILSPNRGGGPQPVPIRSSSFSAHSQGQFSSAMRERAFPSTFEDDESEGLSDTYDERYVPPSLSRGRSYGQDISRSRSQSLATATATRPGPVGSPYLGGTSAMQSWNESLLSNPVNITGRYGEIKPPGTSRYGSLGALGRSPTNILSSSPTIGSGYSNRQTIDISNMSPFVRDVGQILLDDGSAFRELWAGMNPPRDENGGGGSGTTSRRHSVSVVQPRRGNIVGFNVPGGDGHDEPSRPVFTQSSFAGRGGLMLSDDDLASDLGSLSLSPNDLPRSSSSQNPPSQPSSLPIYAPLSRSPPSRDLISPYQSINNLSIPGGSSYSRHLGTPSDNGHSASGTSPSHSSALDQQFGDTQYSNGSAGRQTQNQGKQSELTARFIPGQGIQYMPPQNHGNTNFGQTQYTRARAPSYSNTLPSPISPSGTRVINPQQQPYYPQQMQRRPSDAAQLTDLGKGVPLHAVPASWPLFIVEFKAGRTDLFYLTDLAQDIRVGDLVIVEADRGKDLGKVVNDSITLAEVEAFQKQQQERIGYGDGQPTSPGGSGTTAKKEINPKMIYGKAQAQDTQVLMAKMQDELKALQLCQSKVRAKKLPMEVVDAEYQWDRRKLTFYFIAEKRIDFRELVRELFRLYKTRIWMASLQGGGGYEQ